MLFVFDGPTDAAFTMSTVPVALDIGFYDTKGRLVSAAHDEAVRRRPRLDCPTYRADEPFTYALETLGMPRASLSGSISRRARRKCHTALVGSLSIDHVEDALLACTVRFI